ncbi:MAG TPA: hypothetical protein GXZ29_12215, partial [Clostridiales bacterium]|nr:hypothetical protein [Clostridiales bacterium]
LKPVLWHALDSHPAEPWWFIKELSITVGAIGSPLNVRKILDTTIIAETDRAGGKDMIKMDLGYEESLLGVLEQEIVSVKKNGT